MSNIITIKHGSGAPGKDVLQPYELGYADNGGLFIGGSDGNAISITPKVAESAKSAESAKKLETAQSVKVNLESENAASFDGTSGIAPGVDGVLPITHGGTGADSGEQALKNLGFSITYAEGTKTLFITTKPKTT